MKIEFIDTTILVFGLVLLTMFAIATARRVYWEVATFFYQSVRWFQRLILKRRIHRAVENLEKQDLDRMALAIIMAAYEDEDAPVCVENDMKHHDATKSRIMSWVLESLTNSTKEAVIEAMNSKVMEIEPERCARVMRSIQEWRGEAPCGNP